MFQDINIWQILGGLGLFLLGMQQLEHALKALAGRTFKRFLMQHTANRGKAVLIGVVSTAFLQSSSFVGLTVLAFVGAGIIELASALGIIFGSNLGTTFTGWLVATAGFKFSLTTFALPAVGIGCLGVVLLREGKPSHSISLLVSGFGFLLLGLDFMKSGTESVEGWVDLANLQHLPLLVYLVFGVVLTAIIQSSSATMMLTLTALNAGAISLPASAAVVVGADLGTTVTVLLGAISGSGQKKQVAMGHFLFNLVTVILAFAGLHWLLKAISSIGVVDPLFALVTFHSIFNLLGVVIFFPFLGLFAGYLSRRFVGAQDQNIDYLVKADSKVSDAAIKSLRLETRRLIDQASALNVLAFDLASRYSFYDSEKDRVSAAVFDRDADYVASYQKLKQLEGVILSFALEVQEQSLGPEESAGLNQILMAIRNAVHSAKCVKDIRQNILATRESASDYYNAYYGKFRYSLDSFYKELNTMRKSTSEVNQFEILASLLRKNEASHAEMHRDIYREAGMSELNELEISTLLNVNREVFTSNKNLLFAIADATLEPSRVEDLGVL